MATGTMLYPGRCSAWQPVVTTMVEVPKESIIANTDFTTTSIIAKRYVYRGALRQLLCVFISLTIVVHLYCIQNLCAGSLGLHDIWVFMGSSGVLLGTSLLCNCQHVVLKGSSLCNSQHVILKGADWLQLHTVHLCTATLWSTTV